jgi:hypothetical protein
MKGGGDPVLRFLEVFRLGSTKAVTGLALVAALTASAWPHGVAAQADGTALHDTARGRTNVVALFRAADAIEFERREGAARAALLERFPPGSDPLALVAFLTGTGHGRCEPTVVGMSRRGYYCLVRYGSLAALVLGSERWRLREWVVGVSLASDTETLEDIGVRIPLLGKG